MAGGGLRGLDLSDEQVEKTAELKQKCFRKFAHAQIDGMELHSELAKELGNATIDKAKVSTIVQKIKDHQSAMTDSMVENMLSLAQILTPEQRKQLRTDKIRHFLGLDDHDRDH